MTINELTPEQKTALKAEMAAEEAAKKQRILEDRETYKRLVGEAVQALFPVLQEASKSLVQTKEKIFTGFDHILSLKAEVYNVKANQKSHTFTDESGRSITIGSRTIDRYDDTIHEGIAKVKTYLASLAKDEDSSVLVNTIMDLLRPDKNGNLRAGRVLELRKMANKIGDKELLDGIAIIEESYKPVASCQFVQASYRNANGVEISVPLSMSAI